MKVQLTISVLTAENMRQALTTVLDNCDVHADEAEHLEVLRDMLDHGCEDSK